jgi:hypothetical protein
LCPFLCLCLLTIFLGHSSGFQNLVFSTSCHQLSVSGPLEGPPLPGKTVPVDSGEGVYFLVNQGDEFQSHKGIQKGSGTTLGALLIRLVRNRVRIKACLRRQKESLINSHRDILLTDFWVKPCLSRSGSGSEVLCCVKVCESSRLSPAAR